MNRDITQHEDANDAFDEYYPKSRELERPLDMVEPHLIVRHQAKQPHAVPSKIYYPSNIFSKETLREPDIVVNNPAYSEDGSDFLLGATVQNNYQPPKYLRCSECFTRVLESETELHVCEE